MVMKVIERAVERLGQRAEDQALKPLLDDDRLEDITGIQYEPDNHRVDRPAIAIAKLGFSEIVNTETERSMMGEEFRMLKRRLLANVRGEGEQYAERANLIMVTSALPGEGKTFTATNLALSLAMEQNTHVLLIDGDVIRASLTERMGMKNQPGLIDCLLDSEMKLEDVITATDVPQLRVLPAGRPNYRSTELLAGTQMQAVAAELARRYNDLIVVIDAPPLLAASQASVISDLVGQVLVVVEHGKTPQAAVLEAVAQIKPGRIIGMLLNKSNWPSSSYSYGRYYA